MSARRRARALPAAVLWDMDGTLVDTEPYWIATEHELVAACGNGAWTDDLGRLLVGLDLRASAALLRQHGRVDLPIDEIVARMLDGVIARVQQQVPWRPGARELLAELGAAGVPCALVTMSWRRFVDPVVAALPAGSFAATIVGDEVDRGKPHPEPYRAAARALGVAPRDCVALEDSPTGVASAAAAGCQVIAVPHVVAVPPQRGVRLVGSLRELSATTLARPNAAPRRRAVFAGVAATVVAAGVGAWALRPSQPPPPPIDIAIDGWAPYWQLDDAQATLGSNGHWLRQVSPFWFSATGATTIGVDGGLTAERMQSFVGTARGKGAKVVPSIVDAMPAGGMAAVLADPAQRSTHVATIVALVNDSGFDGIDIDYEQFAFADNPATWPTTAPAWVAFIGELGSALHSAGKLLTVSVPTIYDDQRNGDSGKWVYDYAGIEPHVDQIRIMAYDYSTAAPGPIAPLPFVRQAIAGAKQATSDDSKLVLGVALYGRNWAVGTTGTCPAGEGGTTGVNQRNLPDLLARRGAVPVHDPITGEASFTYQAEFTDGTTSCSQIREVHFVDAEGARLRVDLARTERLGGAALWALGFDGPDTWSSIATLARDPSRASQNSSTQNSSTQSTGG